MLRPPMPTTRPTHYKARYKHDLSPREREVLSLVSKGQTNGEIATSLGLAFDTVKWHVSTILGKLGVESREEAAEYWRSYNSVGAKLARTLSAGAAFLFGKPAAIAASAAGLAAVAALGVAALWLASGRTDDSVPQPQTPVEDTALPRVSAPIRLATTPEGSSDFVVGAGGLWFQRPGEGLYRIDRATGASTHVMASAARWLHGATAANGVVWTVAGDSRGVRGFDEETGKELYAFAFPVEGELPDSWLTATATKVFGTFRDGDLIFRIDIATGQTDAFTQVAAPKGLVVAAGSLWVLESQADRVLRMDPETLAVTATIPLPVEKTHSVCGSCLQKVYASADSIWTVSSDRTPDVDLAQVTRVDSTTNEVLGVWKFRGTTANVLGLDRHGDAWIGTRATGEAQAKLVHISAATNQVTETITLDLNKGKFEPITPAGVVVDGDDVLVVMEEGELVAVRRTP